MKRFFYFVVLMLLSSSAQAGNSFSLVVGGHRIRIEAPRSCRSPSCVSVSIPGIYQTHRARERDAPLVPVPDPVREQERREAGIADRADVGAAVREARERQRMDQHLADGAIVAVPYAVEAERERLTQRVAFAGTAVEFLERFVEIVGHVFFPWFKRGNTFETFDLKAGEES